jgi:D-threo-aldose 1-dehydrogenase
LGGLYSVVSEEQAQATLERAWACGIRLFDTAPLYGFGLSEERVGRFLSAKPRGDFVLSTKVGRLLRKEGVPDPSNYVDGEPIFKGVPPVRPVFDFSVEGVQASLAESCRRLRMDRADLAYLHDPDNHWGAASDQGLAALRMLRAQGRIAGIGAGMNQCAMLTRFVEETDVDVVLIAGRFSLLDNSAALSLLPACARRGVAVVVGGVFNSGILADPRQGATFDYVPAGQHVQDRVSQLKAVCDRHQVPLRAAALQFPRRHPAVTAVVVGARSPEEVDDAVRMGSFPIPDALWSDLDSSMEPMTP